MYRDKLGENMRKKRDPHGMRGKERRRGEVKK
jgi:hypothetical protein